MPSRQPVIPLWIYKTPPSSKCWKWIGLDATEENKPLTKYILIINVCFGKVLENLCFYVWLVVVPVPMANERKNKFIQKFTMHWRENIEEIKCWKGKIWAEFKLINILLKSFRNLHTRMQSAEYCLQIIEWNVKIKL